MVSTSTSIVSPAILPLLEFDSGGESASGVDVGGESALSYHAWWRAVALIAQKCAAVPKSVYQRSADGTGKKRISSHPANRLISQWANEEQRAFGFFLQMAGHLVNRGNAYAYVERKQGKPINLIPMDPALTYPVRENGQLYYDIYPIRSDGERLVPLRVLPRNILHYKGLGYDGLVGYSLWQLAADEIGLGQAERKQESKRFKNGGRPGIVLEAEKKIPDDAKRELRGSWERLHTGIDNMYRTAILDNGLKAKVITPTAEQMQELGLAEMSIIAISNFTGVPPTKLGHGRRNHATLEQEEASMVADCLDFWFSCIDDENTAKLLDEGEEDKGIECRSSREALLRPDLKSKAEALRIMVGGKPIKTQNEARGDLDLPDLDEEGADVLGTPLNFGQGGDDNQPRDNGDSSPGRPRRAAMEGLIRQSVGRIVARIGHQADRMAKKSGEYEQWAIDIPKSHSQSAVNDLKVAHEIVEAKQALNDTILWSLKSASEQYSELAGKYSAKELPAAVGLLTKRLKPEISKRTIEEWLT